MDRVRCVDLLSSDGVRVRDAPDRRVNRGELSGDEVGSGDVIKVEVYGDAGDVLSVPSVAAAPAGG